MGVLGQDSNPDLPTYYTIWASPHPEKFTDGVNNTGGYIFSHIYTDRGDTGGKFGTGVNDANIIRGDDDSWKNLKSKISWHCSFSRWLSCSYNNSSEEHLQNSKTSRSSLLDIQLYPFAQISVSLFYVSERIFFLPVPIYQLLRHGKTINHFGGQKGIRAIIHTQEGKTQRLSWPRSDPY